MQTMADCEKLSASLNAVKGEIPKFLALEALGPLFERALPERAGVGIREKEAQRENAVEALSSSCRSPGASHPPSRWLSLQGQPRAVLW